MLSLKDREVDFRLSFSFPIGGEFFWMKCRSSSDRTRFCGTMPRNRQPATFSTQSPCSLSAWIWPFLKSPRKILRALRGDLADSRQKWDFDMVVLTSASFVSYLSQAPGVPSYFFGGCFFLSMLTGRMLERGLSSSMPLPRLGATVALASILITGTFVHIRVGQTNQIETLSL